MIICRKKIFTSRTHIYINMNSVSINMFFRVFLPSKRNKGSFLVKFQSRWSLVWSLIKELLWFSKTYLLSFYQVAIYNIWQNIRLLLLVELLYTNVKKWPIWRPYWKGLFLKLCREVKFHLFTSIFLLNGATPCLPKSS